jgi:hypothetical protein
VKNLVFIWLKIIFIVSISLYSLTLILPIFNTYNDYYDFFDFIQLYRKLFFGGLIELTLFLASLIYLQILKKKECIIFGMLGNSFLIIDFFINFSSYLFTSQVSVGFFTLFISILLNYSIIIVFLAMKESKIENIKSIVINLGTKYDRLEVKEISQKCKIDGISIVYVLNEMIKNQEINAEYFTSSRAIVFDQRANIREIDNLLEKIIYSKEKKTNDHIIPMDSEGGESPL